MLLPFGHPYHCHVAAARLTVGTMTSIHGARANVHCRKRSFEIALENDSSLRIGPQRPFRHGPSPRSMTFPVTSTELSASKRRLRTTPHIPSMLANPGSVMSTAYPSFMSVYGSDEASMNPETVEVPRDQQKEQEIRIEHENNRSASRINHTVPFAIHHRGSIASLTTASTASSPATTHSSPLFTDPSPSSSPESASSNPSLSTFKGTMESSNHDRSHNSDHSIPSHPVTSTLLPRSESPNNTSTNKNPKNLTINMSTVMVPRPATSSGFDDRPPLSEPTSPFKEPLRSARKKPTNLTIRTPIFNQLNSPRTTPDIPPTPSSKTSLQTFQISPSLLSLATPTTSSSSALHLSLPSFGNGHSRPGSDSSFSSQSVTGTLPGLKEEDEANKSQETQERGYPDGPVLIYDCGLYLYLEPTLEEASRFDTVINVAKEVKNPFEDPSAPSKTITSVLRSELNRSNTPEPQTAASEMSFKSAWEFQPMDEFTPTTPRPDSKISRQEPEYLHVGWDHNSEILQDLYPLCQLIDERTQQGKKVLVHCQLGVSRSASLVIAFGLFKGYQPDFHLMYTQVKGRSRWVGPNMSLIYQLNDFRGKIVKGEYRDNKRSAPPHWFWYTSQTPSAQKTPSQSASSSFTEVATTPQTVKPLRLFRLDKELPPVPLFPKDEQTNGEAYSVNMLTKPSPPFQHNKPTFNQALPLEGQADTAKKSMQPRPLPFRRLEEYSHPRSIPPHRPREAAPPVLQIQRPPSQMDLASQDVPQTPSVFSPRATEFMASPFGLSRDVGDVALNGPRSARSVRSISPPSQALIFASSNADRETLPSTIDPRSPHQQSDNGEILRHIDDFL